MTTPKLQLPELSVGQSGKELTHNQALAILAQLVQANVVDKDLSTPPGSPADGAMYIVAASPTGAWTGHAGHLAFWLNSVAAWTFAVPVNGWSVWVTDEATPYTLKGGAWVIDSSGGMSNPMTTAADIIVGGASGVPARLAAGTNGFVLTMVAGAVAWAAATGGMTNPMSAAGDIIIGGTAGAPSRLAAGTNGYVLTLAAGVPVWAAAPGGSFTGGTLASALNEAPPVTLASAATVNIGAAAANTINISGTTTITAFDTIATGARRTLVFGGALTLTHNATSLILPGAASITTATGDTAEFVSLGSGNWRCVSYGKANGSPLAVTGSQFAGYSETMETMAALAIDVSSSNVKKKVLSANSTFTITGATSGRSHSFTLLLEAGSTYTVTWPGSFKWLGGVPTLTAKDVITGFSVDGGTQWIVSYGGSYV